MKKQVNNNDTWQERIRNMGTPGNDTSNLYQPNANAWEKLEEKLVAQEHRDQTRKRRMVIYWLAAAVSVSMLLLFIGKELFLPKTNGSGQNNNGIVAAPSNKNNNREHLPTANSKQPQTPNPKLYSPNSLSNTALKQTALHSQQPLPNNKQSNPVDTITNLAQAPANPMTNPVTMISPDTIAVAKAVVKKALGTSHISDYTGTIETTPGITMKPQPLRRFIHGTNEEEIQKAAAAEPLKPHNLIKSSTIQN